MCKVGSRKVVKQLHIPDICASLGTKGMVLLAQGENEKEKHYAVLLLRPKAVDSM